MMPSLESLTPCFQGLIPATLYTCSADGIPNVALISHVEYVDARHVALSFQFFNKSHTNIRQNPQALVRLYDPDTGQCWSMRLRFERSESSGPLFEAMALRVEAIASHSGLKGIFKLRAADIYEVLALEACRIEAAGVEAEDTPRRTASRGADAFFTMRALQDLAARIDRATCLEVLLDDILAAVEELLGFRYSMILLAGEQEGKLVTIASRGYRETGVGSEVGVGEGIIGMVAEARQPIRISGLLRDLLYADAVGERAREQGVCTQVERIPLPGLASPESQLGIPLLVRGELLGVLCLESEQPYRFHEDDKAYFEVLGSFIAIAIQNRLLQDRAEEHSETPSAPVLARATAPARGAAPRRRLEVAWYAQDECILVDGEYLIRSLPAKILWKLLSEHAQEGRTEFTNRELRLDKSLQLPEYKDNLESRLILLRRRLEQKCPDIRLVPCARGRFSIDLRAEITLVTKS